MHHVLGARLKVAIKYDLRFFWVREMLLHICQVTSDNIPVRSSFLPRNIVEEHTVGGGGQCPPPRFVRRSGIFLNGTFFGAGQNGTKRDIVTIKNLNIKNIVLFYHHCTTRLSSEQFSYQSGMNPAEFGQNHHYIGCLLT